jgi:ECF transporter S component (folate family)
MLSKEYWKSSANKLKDVRMLSFIALMIALKIVIGFIRIPVGENLRISLTYIIVAIEGMVVGPVAGMTSAFITDNLSFILFPDGAYFPGYTLTAMLGSLFYSIFLYQKKVTWPRIILAKIMNNYLVNVLLGSLWSSMLYGKAYLVYATTSLIKNTILLPLEVILLMVVIKFIYPFLKRKNLVNNSQDYK